MNTKTTNSGHDDRIHYLQNVNYSLLVSGGTKFRTRRTAIGYRIEDISEDGVNVTVADAVCRESCDHYRRKSARDIINDRINSDKDNVRRQYRFNIPHITRMPTNADEWRELDRAIIKAVQYHNNGQENATNAIFLGGYTIEPHVESAMA